MRKFFPVRGPCNCNDMLRWHFPTLLVKPIPYMRLLHTAVPTLHFMVRTHLVCKPGLTLANLYCEFERSIHAQRI